MAGPGRPKHQDSWQISAKCTYVAGRHAKGTQDLRAKAKVTTVQGTDTYPTLGKGKISSKSPRSLWQTEQRASSILNLPVFLG